MNCKQFEDLTHEIAAGKLADATLMRSVLDHAASCHQCAAHLAEAHAVQSSLSALRDHDRAAETPALLETTLRAEFLRARTQSVAPPIAARSWLALSGIAAVILFAALVVAHYLPRLLNRSPQPNPVAASPTPPAPAAPPILHPASSAPNAANNNVARSRPRHRPQESATMTDFIQLPYADDPSTVESGIVVRLQMSRSSLAWLGLSLPITDSSDRIVADLLINQSGTPQAIRFVR
jgi:hypothetical protein